MTEITVVVEGARPADRHSRHDMVGPERSKRRGVNAVTSPGLHGKSAATQSGVGGDAVAIDGVVVVPRCLVHGPTTSYLPSRAE